MNKTIFNLDTKTSIIFVSALGILLGFLSNAFYVDGLMDLIFYVFRFILFVIIYAIFYVIEKKNDEFKQTNKRMIGYLAISSILNVIFSIFITSHILPSLFLTLSGVICFWLIITFTFEILHVCVNNKIINKTITVNEKIGSVVANPIVKLVDNISTND